MQSSPISGLNRSLGLLEVDTLEGRKVVSPTHRPTLPLRKYGGVLISPYPDQEGNKLQRRNSEFFQPNPDEAQYTS